MTSEAFCELRAACFRRSSCSQNSSVFYILPVELVSVIETFEVEQLSQEFYGRLCSILLNGWHVDVIHKYDALLLSLDT